ncbi:MAG: fused MFS/spermidine synthase [Alphaproteobacteria bacterium]|nr:fused MFS/spermidine synthase [Alphaproteobacteria bacterium]
MRRAPLVLLAVAGAMLGFTLEPLVGRLVTLSFGGAVHVWTVCVLVFQAVLLAAYAWAHFVARPWPLVHAAMAALTLVALPLGVSATPDPSGALLPIAAAVLLGAGAPFFVTASAAVVASAWWDDDSPPWFLYAASNAGSLVGLLAYPLLVEPLVGLHAQRLAWSGLYAAFVGLVALTAWRARARPVEPVPAPSPARAGQWVLLSGAASMLSLALTGWIGTEFGSFPLLWTFPLGLYLGSFMLAFSSTVAGWFDRSLLRGLWPDALVMLALFACLAREHLLHPFLYTAFFVVCWQVHAALFRLRPEPAGLTPYYLLIALGGALGSAVVTLVAPNVFPGLWEMPLSIALCALALGVGGERPDLAWFRTVHWRFAVSRAALTGTMALLTVQWLAMQGSQSVIASTRSVYGVFQVRELEAQGARYRQLMHGSTSHGVQILPPDPRSAMPMAYYHPSGGNYAAMELRNGGRLAGIGLGAGAAAAWPRDGESIVFYEIDPDARELARTWFTHLGDTEVRIGDARLVLAGEESTYDALFVDAFSGDGIPVHLLTEEAFRVYLDHLAEDGVLVLHISNRFLDLRGVVRANALDLGLAGAIRTDRATPETADPFVYFASTAVLVRDPARLAELDDRWVRFADDDPFPRHAPWTDDHTNLLEPLGLW